MKITDVEIIQQTESTRLRRDFESGRTVVERVQAPGVVRRRHGLGRT